LCWHEIQSGQSADRQLHCSLVWYLEAIPRWWVYCLMCMRHEAKTW